MEDDDSGSSFYSASEFVDNDISGKLVMLAALTHTNQLVSFKAVKNQLGPLRSEYQDECQRIIDKYKKAYQEEMDQLQQKYEQKALQELQRRQQQQ